MPTAAHLPIAERIRRDVVDTLDRLGLTTAGGETYVVEPFRRVGQEPRDGLIVVEQGSNEPVDVEDFNNEQGVYIVTVFATEGDADDEPIDARLNLMEHEVRSAMQKEDSDFHRRGLAEMTEWDRTVRDVEGAAVGVPFVSIQFTIQFRRSDVIRSSA